MPWSSTTGPNSSSRPTHSKRDRAVLSSATDLGYELLTALVLSDRDGAPIAPVCQQLRAAKGVYSSRSARVQPVPSQLDALAPTMRFVQRLKLGKPTVHIIDREADSVGHYRQWSRHQRLFLVRADAQRVVRHEGQERSLSEVVASLHRGGAFRPSRTVRVSRPAGRAVRRRGGGGAGASGGAEPARRGSGPRRLVRGAKLPLRLVVSEVRDGDGALLATWLLLTNVPASVTADEVALWYYWRWRVESYFKLLKGAGLHLEQWQQETAAGVGQAVAGGEHGVRGGLAGGAERGPRGGGGAAVAGAAERPPDEVGRGVHRAGAAGRLVGVALDDEGVGA